MPPSSLPPASEQPLRALAGATEDGAKDAAAKLLVVTIENEVSLVADDKRLAALLPPPSVAKLAADPPVFRSAYRRVLFERASDVGALVSAHREQPLRVCLPDSDLGRATASVLDEFFAAWAPC